MSSGSTNPINQQSSASISGSQTKCAYLKRTFLTLLTLLPTLTFAVPPPVLTPTEQLETFVLAEPGYRIELVASDPMIQDPVAMTFDGQGRLWVVEMRGYMRDINGKGSKDPIGRISVLEDTDADGRMDRSSVFLDDLVLPRAIAVFPDGVLVAENKPLWFAKDTDGDLVADEKTLVDKDYAKDNIEHSANGLLYAMDNWIYNAKEGHRYRRNGDKWIRDETEKRGQWGICQDDFGRLFYNYNHSQLHTDLVPPNTLTRNPHHEPSTGLSVGVTNTNEVFPIRPNNATNRGYIPGALDEKGSIKQFTSACAPFIYREFLMPAFTNSAFVAETAGNLVKRNTLNHSGIGVSGSPAYPDKDFLASTDERFRPCWISSGPDGALYIVDMYRGIVQDAPHMSPYLREHSIERDMESPIHLGRIWRIVPEDHLQPDPPDFASMKAAELVKQLENPSGWWRDEAQKQLVSRDLRGAIPMLKKMVTSHPDEPTRLHALWTLEGLKSDSIETAFSALHDESAAIQAAALRVLVSLEASPEQIADQIEFLSGESPDESLVLQMVLTLGDLRIKEQRRFSLLADLLLPRVTDPLFRDACLSSLAEQEADFLVSVWERFNEIETPPVGASFLVESLSQATVNGQDPKPITTMLELIAAGQSGLDWRHESLLSGIRLLQPELVKDPIQLAAKPTAADQHPELRSLLAWPGHTPEPPAETKVRQLTKKEHKLFVKGRQVYLTSCVACHGADGKGTPLLAPPLAGSDWVTGSKERLGRVLLHGLAGPITVSGKRYTVPEIQSVMPPLATLGNTEIAAVLTYIRREWGNEADPITSGDMNRIRIESQGRTTPWTEEDLKPYAKTPTKVADSH